MKIAITGHTKRIGKAILDSFKQGNVETIGFSKSNGYDITKPSIRKKIVKATKDFDVFINNAHKGFAQVEMLNAIFDSWQHEENKLIINIGVDTVPYTAWQVVHRQYPVEKVALHSQIELLHNTERNCKITNLALGWVDTEFNKNIKEPKLSYENITNTIKWIIDMDFEVKQIVMSAYKNSVWQDDSGLGIADFGYDA